MPEGKRSKVVPSIGLCAGTGVILLQTKAHRLSFNFFATVGESVTIRVHFFKRCLVNGSFKPKVHWSTFTALVRGNFWMRVPGLVFQARELQGFSAKKNLGHFDVWRLFCHEATSEENLTILMLFFRRFNNRCHASGQRRFMFCMSDQSVHGQATVTTSGSSLSRRDQASA